MGTWCNAAASHFLETCRSAGGRFLASCQREPEMGAGEQGKVIRQVGVVNNLGGLKTWPWRAQKGSKRVETLPVLFASLRRSCRAREKVCQEFLRRISAFSPANTGFDLLEEWYLPPRSPATAESDGYEFLFGHNCADYNRQPRLRQERLVGHHATKEYVLYVEGGLS